MSALRFDVRWERPGFRLEGAAELSQMVTGVFGPSGAGKTSLLLILAGLRRPDAGWVEVAGQRVTDGGRHVLPTHRRGLGVVFQEDRLFPHRSVRGNLAYGHRQGGSGPSMSQVVELLELGSLLGRAPRGLSGGEQRRVAIGRALLAGPRLLLLDEPLVGLDQRLRAQILPFLRHVRDELAVPMVVVSHDAVSLLQLTDHLLLIDGGRVFGPDRYPILRQDHATRDILADGGLINVLSRAGGPGGDDGWPIGEAGVALRLPGGLDPLQVAIDPRDVALARHRIEGISIRNQLPGRVTAVTALESRVLVDLDVGVPLIAEVTPAARRELGLEPGAEVWVLVKSTAIRPLA